MSVEMNISSEESDGWVIVAPAGELDIATSDVLNRALSENRDTILDLSEVSFMDSTGIRAIVGVHNRLNESGNRFRLIVPSGPVARIIEITGLTGALDLVDSRDAAFSS